MPATVAEADRCEKGRSASRSFSSMLFPVGVIKPLLVLRRTLSITINMILRRLYDVSRSKPYKVASALVSTVWLGGSTPLPTASKLNPIQQAICSDYMPASLASLYARIYIFASTGQQDGPADEAAWNRLAPDMQERLMQPTPRFPRESAEDQTKRFEASTTFDRLLVEETCAAWGHAPR